MKQVIVLMAMIMLGLAIAGFINSFSGTAEELTGETNAGIRSVMGMDN